MKLNQTFNKEKTRNISRERLKFSTFDRRQHLNTLLGVGGKKQRVVVDGELLASEAPYNHIKAVGRTLNNFDNMDRKFNIQGLSPRTKVDMWDMLIMADHHKKQQEDSEYLSNVQNQRNELRDYYRHQINLK